MRGSEPWERVERRGLGGEPQARNADRARPGGGVLVAAFGERRPTSMSTSTWVTRSLPQLRSCVNPSCAGMAPDVGSALRRACPKPLAQEASASEYEGVNRWALVGGP